MGSGLSWPQHLRLQYIRRLPSHLIMSERREASNHRLALTIEQQQQQQDTNAVTAIPVKDSRRKRSSTSSNGTVTVKRPTPSRSRSAVSKTLPIKTDTDFSCVAQLSPTSPDKMSSVYFTKTGRVSKAKKGRKVHDCDCGRVSLSRTQDPNSTHRSP